MKYEVALHWPRLACERRSDVFVESCVGFCSVCMYSCISDLVIYTFVRSITVQRQILKVGVLGVKDFGLAASMDEWSRRFYRKCHLIPQDF